MKEKKKILITVILLLSLICVTIGITFAAFSFIKEGTVENTLETGTIILTYTEGKTGIILEDALPLSDDTGKMLTGVNNVFDFTVSATLGKDTVITYEVTALKIPITDMEPLLDSEVKLYLERAIDPETTYTEILAPTNFIPKTEASEIGSPVGSMILDTGTFSNEGVTIHNYRLRMWVDENAEIGEAPKKYGIRINVYAKQMEIDPIAKCFTFDKEKGAITDYNESCPKDVVIPDAIDGVTVTTIENATFKSNQLTSVIIPNTVTTINSYAFADNQLSSIVFPDSVVSIGQAAFYNNQLTNILFPNSELNLYSQAFNNNQLEEVTIPSNVNFDITGTMFSNNPIKKVILDNENLGYGPLAGLTETLEVIVNNTVKALDWSYLLEGTPCAATPTPPTSDSPSALDTNACSFITGIYTARNGRQIHIIGPENLNIVAIYQYNQTTEASNFCVTGEESTCQPLNKARYETYESGTIIKYKVNDTEEKYFHVVSDNGDTLTLQQRENLVYRKAWYSGINDNTKGPTTILLELESATNDWTNVLDQTYTMGTTIFKDNFYTGCRYDSTNQVYNCITNVYTLEQRTGKARLISVQEVYSLGCTCDTKSCPVWMYNYLKDATIYGGTVNDGTDVNKNAGYWTMTANSYGSASAWYVTYQGKLNNSNTSSIGIGARPVVVIKK